MVVTDLIYQAARAVAGWLGLHGTIVTIAAASIAGIYLLHEFGDFLVIASRWVQVASIVLAAIATVLLAGVLTGILSLDGSVGTLLDAVASLANQVLH